MNTHDLIVSYKNTENHDFPLILVIGREPNNDKPFSNTCGTYDFDDAPRCAFWNQSYGVIGKLVDSQASSMKNLCRQSDASPIAFTDASPIPVGHHNPEKHKIKASIHNSTIDDHVENILAMSQIIDRVSLVILTGHHTASLPIESRRVFEYSSSQLVRGLDSKGIQHISVPFMFGNNQPAILDAFRRDKASKHVVKQVVREFRTLPPAVVENAA